MSFTPQQMVDALYRADKELSELATQFAWFKGQRDYWKDQLDVALAHAKVMDDGPVTKSKEAALDKVSQRLDIEVPWVEGDYKVTLIDMVRITEASFDLIAKSYDRMDRHISILQTVNKNIMLDYQRGI